MAAITSLPLRVVDAETRKIQLPIAAAQGPWLPGQIVKVVAGQLTARAAVTDVQLVIVAQNVPAGLAANTLVEVYRVNSDTKVEVNISGAPGAYPADLSGAFGLPATDTANITTLLRTDVTNKRFKVVEENFGLASVNGLTATDTNIRVRAVPVIALTTAGTGTGDTGATWY